MAKYVITITDRWEVEADSPEHALGSYRVAFDNVELDMVGLDEATAIPQDDFRFIGGSGSAEEADNE